MRCGCWTANRQGGDPTPGPRSSLAPAGLGSCLRRTDDRTARVRRRGPWVLMSLIDAATSGSGEPLGHQLLGRGQRGDAAQPGAVEHGGRRGPDLTDSLRRPRLVVTVGLFGDIDDATCVRQKVGDIENARLRKRVRNPRTSQLIV